MSAAESQSVRVALVTGGTGGIGNAACERLADSGMAVAVHYAGNKSKADAIVSGITSSGGRAIAVGGDVAEESDMVAAFEEVEAQFGGVDVVVNTAASCCSARSHPSAWTTWIGCTA